MNLKGTSPRHTNASNQALLKKTRSVVALFTALNIQMDSHPVTAFNAFCSFNAGEYSLTKMIARSKINDIFFASACSRYDDYINRESKKKELCISDLFIPKQPQRSQR